MRKNVFLNYQNQLAGNQLVGWQSVFPITELFLIISQGDWIEVIMAKPLLSKSRLILDEILKKSKNKYKNTDY